MDLRCPRCSRPFSATAQTGESVHCPHCKTRLSVVSTELAREAAAGLEGKLHPMTVGAPGASAPTAAPDEPTPADPAASAGRLPMGFSLCGYEIRKTLGQGGMATIYEAVQSSTGNPVAIKVLSRRLSRDPAFVDRFLHEAGLLAALNHPNIVNILDRGESHGLHFIVMELVEGVTLNQLLHAVDLTPRHFVHVVEELASALEYVHSMGVVHRDIKPSNVLVTRHGVVKLTDFGIAIPASARSRKSDRDSASLGTASYMAPEQAEDPLSVDARADIFSLAVTFYRVFTRQLPSRPPIPASEANPIIPAAADPVLLRAMHPNPHLRYQGVREFCDDLLRAFAPLAVPGEKDIESESPLALNPGTFSPDMSSGSIQRVLRDGKLTSSRIFLVPKIAPPTETSPRRLVLFVLSALVTAALIASYLWFRMTR